MSQIDLNPLYSYSYKCRAIETKQRKQISISKLFNQRLALDKRERERERERVRLGLCVEADGLL